jgi:hypothetical protein
LIWVKLMRVARGKHPGKVLIKYRVVRTGDLGVTAVETELGRRQPHLRR